MSFQNISEELLSWYAMNKRELPWRNTKDPYPIWISEVILQQTRVNQGLPYFHSFMEHFPTLQVLARAPEDAVLRVWQGLGYYSRARNLHAGAKYIVSTCGGVFPDNYDTLLKVKGIGPYTAAAIASICFGRPTPVVDGNVYRVISRHYGVDADISLSSSRKIFVSILNEIISTACPGDFNQALMELGATVCIPQSPSCDSCPVSESCHAFHSKNQYKYPVKSKKVKVTNRYFHYLVLKSDTSIAMRKRRDDNIWAGLYEFYLEEVDHSENTPSFLKNFHEYGPIEQSISYTHVLTHQKIETYFYLIEVKEEEKLRKLAEERDLQVFSLSDIVDLPKSKLIVNYLTEHNF